MLWLLEQFGLCSYVLSSRKFQSDFYVKLISHEAGSVVNNDDMYVHVRYDIGRARPWMTSRAVGLRRDRTSSFPSRAVTCGVVYGFILSHVYTCLPYVCVL
jgi:hypothetical protein